MVPGALLFVYGSLLSGTGQRPVDRVLGERAEDRGPGFIRARLYDLGEYPGAVPSAEPGDRVLGRLFRLRVPAPALARLDRYERYDARCEPASEFLRREVEVRLSGYGPPVAAWVYYYNKPVSHRRRVRPGDWQAWLRRRRAGAPPHSRGRTA
jgi:gamma-glutamylcyclotransferase (GGCT)/AIG2-like uncharacterized protein YtfP